MCCGGVKTHCTRRCDEMYIELFLTQGSKFSVILFHIFFQVNDVIDTPPKFNRTLFAGGIAVGDKVNDPVTTLVVSINIPFVFKYRGNISQEHE
jgi:hypothetical protein